MIRKIIFGLSLDQSPPPFPPGTLLHYAPLGPSTFLSTLENHLGLSGHRNDNEYLRVEQYRQALSVFVSSESEAFFGKAFNADQFGTAADLLNRRDELLMAGFYFERTADLPLRILQFVQVEEILRADNNIYLSPGKADRWQKILAVLPKRNLPDFEIRIIDPIPLLPPIFQRLFRLLAQLGFKVTAIKGPKWSGDGDLRNLQKLLSTTENKACHFPIKGDGSLILIKGKRDTDLALFLAGLLKKNTSYLPSLLLSGAAQVLDNALIHEGLPSIGVKVTSLSRPPLQLLKLATSFLWEPLDPYKVLEFVSLSVQPIEQQLANRIAQQIAQSPGVQSESWRSMIGQYFRELEERKNQLGEQAIDEIKRNYRFWFERDQFDVGGKAPKIEAIQLFDFLRLWALKKADESNKEAATLRTLAEKARQVKELLEELPEQELDRLELERVVRTIYEPTPLQLNEKQLGALPVYLHPAAVHQEQASLLWWNFVQSEPDYFFAQWSKPELDFLASQSIIPEGPQLKNERLIWQRKQAILWTNERLILICPEVVEGREVLAHPLLGDMEAALDGLEKIEFSIDELEDRARLARFFKLPSSIELSARSLGNPKAFVHTRKGLQLAKRETETITSLELLFYYPYQWIFKYLLKLRKSPILSIVEEHTLQGNLAHRLIEQLLQEKDVYEWSQEKVDKWIEQHAYSLFRREGAVLLLYGKEPLRVGFTKKMQYAAWSLLDLLKKNQWEVAAIEKEMEGEFLSTSIKGRADLILKRGVESAVLDLKWRGSSRRKLMIKNMEDLQLVLYAFLLGPGKDWAHTGYYILSKGELIARNTEAFSDITPLTPDLDAQQTYQTILERMQATFRWRQSQLQKGQIEIRCERTSAELEEYYGDLLSLLEMKTKDAPFDDYRTLINLIN